MKFNVRNTSMTALFLLLLAALMPIAADAASPSEFTALQKFDFDKTVSAADGALADKLTQQYRDYSELKEQNRSWEEKVGALHYRNEDRAAALRKRIGQIDAAKINSLKIAAEQAKKRYEPLFELYSSVNAQLAAARKLKNKTLTSLLAAQAEGLKVSVQLAREDIKLKQAALTSARSAASASMKKVRDTLSGIDPVKVQIKAGKESLSTPKDSRAMVWKTFTQAVKKHDAKTASERFASVNALSRQLLEQQQKLHVLETRVAEIIGRAEGQVPR